VRLTRASFVSIALIRGATGNGSELLIACDMSFASRRTRSYRTLRWAWGRPWWRADGATARVMDGHAPSSALGADDSEPRLPSPRLRETVRYQMRAGRFVDHSQHGSPRRQVGDRQHQRLSTKPACRLTSK